MRIHIERPPLQLASPIDGVIAEIINLLPDYSAGDRLHALYVNKLESALPGNYSQLFGTGPSFRSVFFPSWQPDSLLPFVADTGLDDLWWNSFSIAVLCQAIAEMGSSIRGQMLSPRINADVAAFNETLRQRSYRTYSRVLATTFPPLVALLNRVDKNSAKQQFHDGLLNNVLNRQLWFQAGMWTSPDWEMFNQYAKYMALGATDAEVDSLIRELLAAGLPIPSHVSVNAWRTFAEELRVRPNVDVNDIRGASSDPISRSTYLPNFAGGMPSTMPNGNCYEFTANSQPGNVYRRPPGGCCFTGDTEVLSGTGMPIRLRDVKEGDTILTRNGTATVAFVATPLHAARRLYSINRDGPIFTASHPFVNADADNASQEAPMLLALEPSSLAWSVPTLGEKGIGQLAVGRKLFSRPPGAHSTPKSIAISELNEVQEPTNDRYLYDLNLQTESGLRQEFWVGRGSSFYLVSPEFPVLSEAPNAAILVLAAMSGVIERIANADTARCDRIVAAINQSGAGIFHSALLEALATTSSFGTPVPPAPIYERVNKLYASIDGANTELKSVISVIFDAFMSTVGQWLVPLIDLGWRRVVLLGGNVLSLSIFDVSFVKGDLIPEGRMLRLSVRVEGAIGADEAQMWARQGQLRTNFHRYFGQLLHFDLAGEDRPLHVRFSMVLDGSTLPICSAEIPDAISGTAHSLESSLLRDSQGAVVGTLRFDLRRIGRDAASQELGDSGRWTELTASAYANSLGQAMVEPILARLRELAPDQ